MPPDTKSWHSCMNGWYRRFGLRRMQQLNQWLLYLVIKEDTHGHGQYHMYDDGNIGIHEIAGAGVNLRKQVEKSIVC